MKLNSPLIQQESMYLNPDLTSRIFLRLRESEPTPKRGIERTSSLFRFLAFDSLCKSQKRKTISFDPDTGVGMGNRKKLVEAYKKIAFVSDLGSGKEAFIDNLGHCNSSGKRSCSDKVANDFLTVQLKKASQSGTEQAYPSRPSSLLSLGVEVYGHRWGISKHEDWEKNLGDFLADRLSKTALIDLAVVVTRGMSFSGDIFDSLEKNFRARQSDEFVQYWIKQARFLKREFRRTTNLDDWAVPEFVNELSADEYSRVTLDISSLEKANAELEAENSKLRAQLAELQHKFDFLNDEKSRAST